MARGFPCINGAVPDGCRTYRDSVHPLRDINWDQNLLHIPGTKTDSRPREVPMTEDCVLALRSAPSTFCFPIGKARIAIRCITIAPGTVLGKKLQRSSPDLPRCDGMTSGIQQSR